MKWKVLVSAPYMQPVPRKYRKILEDNGVDIIVPKVEERLSEAELLDIIADIDGVIAGDDRFTERVFEAAGRLKVISKWGTGIDSFDADAAKAHNVVIRNTPGAFTVPVTESVFGYLLSFARKIPWMGEDIRKGGWAKIPGVTLAESTLGIIGVGDIGKSVARAARIFGARVLGNDIVRMPEAFVEETGIEMVSKEELLRQADFVSLNCNLNPTSFHVMGAREFSLMKPTAYIINTARGPLVDEPALIAALKSGKIAGAGLDVFEIEPLPLDSPLRKMDNVLGAAHNSNSSPRAWERVHESTVEHLLEELRKRQ